MMDDLMFAMTSVTLMIALGLWKLGNIHDTLKRIEQRGQRARKIDGEEDE